MCQYSCQNGFANDWHLVHLGSRAVGGAALVIAEATAVEARGRISPGDLGLYTDEHTAPLARVAKFITQQGAVAGIQLAHAGRKASMGLHWEGSKALSPEEGGWHVVSASAIPFSESYKVPSMLSPEQLVGICKQFQAAAVRAKDAGFGYVEIHAAHGYLLHNFLSPLSNHRSDQYGGPFENRVRLLLEVVRSVREVWPKDRVLGVRLSCTDWVDGGWAIEDTVRLAQLLEVEDVDIIDCSSGGNVPKAVIPVGPGYQVPFAEAVKRGTSKLCVAAVGMITEPTQANGIIAAEQADFVFLARELLRDPYFPRSAAKELGHKLTPPLQYDRAW